MKRGHQTDNNDEEQTDESDNENDEEKDEDAAKKSKIAATSPVEQKVDMDKIRSLLKPADWQGMQEKMARVKHDENQISDAKRRYLERRKLVVPVIEPDEDGVS